MLELWLSNRIWLDTCILEGFHSAVERGRLQIHVCIKLRIVIRRCLETQTATIDIRTHNEQDKIPT
jgi:hypothetical protein